MSFRLRLTALASLAVAVAIIGTSVVVYYTDRQELVSQVDGDLSSALALAPLRELVATVPAGFTKIAGAGAASPLQSRITRGRPSIGALKQFGVVLPRISADVQVRARARRQGALPANAPARFATVMVRVFRRGR